MDALPLPFEIISGALIVAVLAADIFYAYRHPHVPSTRESAIWVGVYVALALVFAVVLGLVGGIDHAGQFVAGWLTEYSLSIDNLFVFLIILGGFAVPKIAQQSVLMWGILLALVFRGIFIVIGAQLITAFSWIFYLFGAFLVYTAITQAFGSEHSNPSNGRIIRFVRRRLKVHDEFDGQHFHITVDGKRMLTPIIIVLVAVGSTDVLFALDSIPAIFGITQSAFIVFTANVFALMGLRQLYFLLGDLVERLVYLKYGIAVILAFIGVKLVLHALHENSLPFVNGGEHLESIPDIGTGVSLGVIILSMAAATVASLLRMRRSDPKRGVSAP
jgi:tellurite resistance protein TerC